MRGGSAGEERSDERDPSRREKSAMPLPCRETSPSRTSPQERMGLSCVRISRVGRVGIPLQATRSSTR